MTTTATATATATATTTGAASSLSSSPSYNEAEEEVHVHLMCITKRGFYNKKADALISKIVTPLFVEAFGCGATKASVRHLNIKHALVLCIEEAGKGAAAAALAEPKPNGVVKLHGVCVREELRGRGYGTRFMQSVPDLLPSDTTKAIELCIDRGTPNTARLLAWYTTCLGYHEVPSFDGSEIRLCKRLDTPVVVVVVEEEEEEADGSFFSSRAGFKSSESSGDEEDEDESSRSSSS